MPKNIANQKSQLFLTFLNHCATLIQANFKGYQQKKHYRKFLPVYRRFKQLMFAKSIGWKTRKVLKLSFIRNKAEEIKHLNKTQTNMQTRIKKRDFSDQVIRLLKGGCWLYYFSKQNRLPLHQRKSSSGNKKQGQLAVKTNLKIALSLIPRNPSKNNSARQLGESNDKDQAKKNGYKHKDLLVSKLSQKLVSAQSKQKCEEQKRRQHPKTTNNFEKNQKQSDIKKVSRPEFNQMDKDWRGTPISILNSVKPESNQMNEVLCKTPISILNSVKELSFRTKGRVKKMSLQQTKINDFETELSFRHVNTLANSLRKGGLHMTLFKRQPCQDQKCGNQANLQVVSQFTKDKQQSLTYPASQVSFKYRQVSEFQAINYTNGFNLKNPLKMKVDQFEKRRLEHQKKVLQFRNNIYLK